MTLNVDLMQDQELRGKRVLIREDLNVPIENGTVTSDARIRAALPTIEMALAAGARVILMSHLGRPAEGEYEKQFSLAPVAQHLSVLLGTSVALVEHWREGVNLADGEVVLLENVRFNSGENANDEGLSRAYAALCDILLWTLLAPRTVHRRLLTALRATPLSHALAPYLKGNCAH